MPDKAWKKRERDVANYFKGQRTPLSGGNGKVTRADVIHEELFIECKLRAKHTVVSLWDDTACTSSFSSNIFNNLNNVSAFSFETEISFSLFQSNPVKFV